jgi:hypothetical protein
MSKERRIPLADHARASGLRSSQRGRKEGERIAAKRLEKSIIISNNYD